MVTYYAAQFGITMSIMSISKLSRLSGSSGADNNSPKIIQPNVDTTTVRQRR